MACTKPEKTKRNHRNETTQNDRNETAKTKRAKPPKSKPPKRAKRKKITKTRKIIPILRANRKQAYLGVIQANLSDIQADWNAI